jgi:hypothetical protein
VKVETTFKTETDLVRHFKDSHVEAFLRQVAQKAVRRFVFLEEFDCYNGVADIVLAIIRPYARTYKRRQTVNHNWLAPLSQLSQNEVVSLDQYVALCGVSNRVAREHLEHFTRAEFLKRLDNGRYRVSKAYKPVLESTISLEAKLHDWKRALVQAYRYRWFSNYSFVLLPSEKAVSAKSNIELFRRHDVGLVTIGTSGLFLHYCPVRRNRPANEAFLRANEAAYSQLTAAESFSV